MSGRNELFGVSVSPAELDALVPGLAPLVGVRHFREDNGPGAGQRIIRIDNGGGLAVELLPDRTCDIGQVWCGAVPYGWMGPMGVTPRAAIGTNTALSGLMTTCGFDHIRQPESVGGIDYPLHGSMMHQPASILSAGIVEESGSHHVRVVAEAVQFSLSQGGMRLRRTVSIPLGKRELILTDEVTVLSVPQPVMAMYHINLGFPLSGPGSRLLLADQDVTDPCIATDGIRTRPAGEGRMRAQLLGASDDALFAVEFEGSELSVFQTLRNSRPGVNLICIEPASHERLPRRELFESGALVATLPGDTKRFHLRMAFGKG
jgi:hypothetical protein